MLTRIAPGVHVHTSECIATNSIIVDDGSEALVIDPGLTSEELTDLAAGVRSLGLEVVAGFATHPDWDHALWHPSLGEVPRYGTARAAAVLAELLAQPDWQTRIAEGLPPEIADDVPLELFGLLTALPRDATRIPWTGPSIRILEHRGHAEGHAALLIEEHRVLVAGDMLSDVLVPMPNLYGDAPDPLRDYLHGLQLLEDASAGADVVVPGHGSVGDSEDLRARIALDRAYIEALRDGRPISDPRVAQPKPGWEWVAYIHEGNVERVARRS
ncbi:MBL fold metallo-hydrolase [Leucobacter tenebrionis]|uniref:MBL fold metallo-hydrolase n=1 Tax=Leucobacter tenebrionis TaxID=2873270 RepID=UPI001CA70568|nr:MBL fold metallo-hydrolase [Leucobacter tenebrionis]QZY50876.1 MBL fold metallo-hydrolase [Leucobacter tenebrionis]